MKRVDMYGREDEYGLFYKVEEVEELLEQLMVEIFKMEALVQALLSGD